MKKHELAALLALCALTVVFFFPVIFFGKTLFLRDLTYIFHPWKALCTESIQSGRLPLWNPYAYCGMPLMANWQSAVFYPLSILFYIFSFPAALKIFHCAQLVLGGYFAYLFVKSEYSSNKAALAVMILFAFNGFIITKLEFLSYIGVISWTFALLLLRKRPLLLAIALCMSFLAGHQIFIFQTAVLVLYLLMEPAGLKEFKASLKTIAAAGSLSLSLAALQLLPTLELIAGSNRGKEGIDFKIAMLHSLDIKSLPGLVSPLLHKASADLVGGEFLQWDTTMYIGFFGIFLAALGALKAKYDRKASIAWLLIITGIILSLGSSTPVYPWLYDNFFVFHTMRYPVQYIYLTVTGLMLLAAYGARQFKYGLLITALIAGELLLVSKDFQPLAPDNYFYRKPLAAEALQSLSGNNRFLLSPGTEKDRYIRAASILEGWQAARDRMYNLTSLPYHVPNAYGFGEPLTGFAIENKINRLYNTPNAVSAIPLLRELGAGYLLCKTELADSSGYRLLARSPLFVYQLETMPALCEAVDNSAPVNIKITESRPEKYSVSIDSPKSSSVVFRQTAYPGWQLFVNGSKTRLSPYRDIFTKWEVAPGASKAFYVYRPLSFAIGLLLTCAAILLLSAYAVARLLKGKP